MKEQHKKHVGMKAKTIRILFISLVLIPLGLRAQNDGSSSQNSYEKFKKQAQKEYDDFVSHAQSEFEAFLAKAWTEYQSFAGQSGAFSEQKPTVMPSVTVQSGIIDVQAPSLESENPIFETEPENRNSSIIFDASPSNNLRINFYGRDMAFNIPKNLRVSSDGVRERHVSKYYATLRQNDADHILQQQLDDAVSQMGLNEWGYFVLLRAITERLYTNMNDRVLFSFYMLHSHGFNVRIGLGSKSNQLMLLLAFAVLLLPALLASLSLCWPFAARFMVFLASGPAGFDLTLVDRVFPFLAGLYLYPAIAIK
jgi:hypothetical protein